MRVTHLISGDLWAGAEVATFELLRAQRDLEGVEPTAVVLNPGQLVDRVREAGIAVELEPEAGRSFRVLAASVRARLAGADVVHAHRYKEDLLAALSGRPWVATQHGRPEPFSGAARLRAAITGSLDVVAKRLSAGAVIGVSSEVSAWLAPRVGRRKVETVANGIADPFGRIAPPPWRERPKRIGFLGRLSPVKRPLLAVECVARMPGIELEMVGDGELRGEVEARIEALGVGDRVHLRGHVADPLPLVAGWRALISTSAHEGHPMSVLEALALGTPVAYTAAGVGDAVGPEAGVALASDAEPDAWAEALTELVERTGEAAAAAARGRFESHFDVRRTAEETVAVYRRVLAASARR